MSLRTADYDFVLPEELIASAPAARREDSRMMVLDRAAKTITHARFRDFESHVGSGDLVVLNNTRVIPARLFSDDGKVELLLLERLSPLQWTCLVKPGRKMRVGAEIPVGGLRTRVLSVLPDGGRVVEFEREPDLERIGHMPLPPYLKRPDSAEDRERYQTVYANVPGAVAAPTAGLHFTPEILARIPHAFLTLHVGAGTFKPVATEDISGHIMHSERFEISGETVQRIDAAARVLAVGTTTVRVLETLMQRHGRLVAGEGSTEIFIHPPHEFRKVGALLTNFHLPRSTLLMLVSAFAGREFILRAYAEAIRERYRFYSYGDCMLIL